MQVDTAAARSLTYKLKSSGLNIDPWGTPAFIEVILLRYCPMDTSCALPSKKLVSHFKQGPRNPFNESFVNSRL